MNGHKDYEFLGIEQRKALEASGYRWFRNPTGKQSPLPRREGRLRTRNPRRHALSSESQRASKSIAGSDRQHRPIYSSGITASGLTIIGYELRLSSLGRFVPVKLAQQLFWFV